MTSSSRAACLPVEQMAEFPLHAMLPKPHLRRRQAQAERDFPYRLALEPTQMEHAIIALGYLLAQLVQYALHHLTLTLPLTRDCRIFIPAEQPPCHVRRQVLGGMAGPVAQ